MRWRALLVCQALSISGLAETPDNASIEEVRVQMHRLFEACRAHVYQAGRFPANHRDLEGLLSGSLRAQFPASVEFKDPEADDNRLIRQSPVGERTACLRANLGSDRWVNVSGTGWVFESKLYWESEFVDLIPRHYMNPGLLKLDHRSIPDRAMARSPRCGAGQINLVPRCNGIPTTPWFLGPLNEDKAPALGEWLPSGVCEHDGVLFDARGLLQIQGKLALQGEGRLTIRSYPDQIVDLPVHQRASWLHLLAGTVERAPLRAAVAVLRLHFASGATAEIPLLYGEHLSAPSDAPGNYPRLYPASGAAPEWCSLDHLRLPNPKPLEVIESFDFCSGGTPSHPFILAVTIEE